jgi:hypothetical protein
MTLPEPDDSGAAEPPLSAAESLALIDAEQGRRVRRIQAGATLTCGLWGFVYLLSFGSIYLTRKQVLPGAVAGVLTGVLFVGAIVFSAVFGARAGQGMRGPSRVTGAMYGFSWTIGYLALTAVNVGLQRNGLTDDQVVLLWSGSALLLAGVLYLAAGAIYRSWVHYTVGAWTMLAAAGSVFAGVPGNFLVLALAGGGGFLAQAVFYGWFGRRGGTRNAGHGPVGINVPAV